LINDAFKPALQIVEREWRKERAEGKAKKEKNAGTAALVIVGRLDQEKFFSNGASECLSLLPGVPLRFFFVTGFDLSSVFGDPTWFTGACLRQLVCCPHFRYKSNLIVQRPMTHSYCISSPSQVDFGVWALSTCLTLKSPNSVPTVAAINGHCFAAGAVIALACDYRVMTDGAKRRAWICMNEVDIGAPLPVSIAAIMRMRAAKASVIRKFALEGHRFSPPEALEAGLVDEIVAGGTQGILKRAREIAQEKAPKAREGVWGLIKV
jgi:Delta3-Delta2-enoyl-CoA isomerase